MKNYKTRHEENLGRLARLEGQIRGIRRMIEEGEYCMDIATQIQAARAALQAVSHRILRKHLEQCLADAAQRRSRRELDAKMTEIMNLLKRSEV
ncbi:MAG: metal-sensitive transcriptional regulator [Verrucomicrobia bacterium]|nr:metal-sensitive transcriptional regulator [Verrucomicrobiota bacterium]MBU1908827.1 metal-sensitive transcriptional regulator [Verrucomicrobiota bacterium]